MKHRVHRRNIIAAAATITVLLAVGFWLYHKPAASEAAIIKLDGYAITRDHLALYENEYRAEVASYFYREYQLDPNEDTFWETEVNGEIPQTVLSQKAMDSLVCDTTERIEAARYGITSAITLEEIKESLEQENKTRQSSSGPSYGPSQYGLMEYISRTQMGVRDSLKERLLQEILKPTEQQLQDTYTSADPALFDKGHAATVGLFMYYGMKVGEYPKELETIWETINRDLSRGKTPAEIVSGINQSSEYRIEYEEIAYDTAEIPRDNQEIAWLAEEARDMSPGQVSAVLDYGASQGLLIILHKTDYGQLEYKDSQTLLTNLWLEQAYPDYINQCIQNYGYTPQNQLTTP